MNWKTIHHSPHIRTALAIIVGLVLVLVVFKLGELYGYHRAGFGKRYGDNFNRMFVDPDGRGGNRFFMMMGDGMPNGHGAVGKVVSVALPKLTVAGPDNLEKVVVTTADTIVHKFRDTASVSDIKTGDYLVVLGDPNANGEIEARLIRIVPTPPTPPMTNNQ